MDMADTDKSLKLTAREVAQAFGDPLWAAQYPPILTTEQVAALLQIPKQTLYDWSARGLLKNCCRKTGKHLRFFRDRLVTLLFNEGITSDG
jgi:excisionase family DNA binding protein